MRDPCYSDKLVNPESKTCLHGSEWSKTAQKIMGGDISEFNSDI